MNFHMTSPGRVLSPFKRRQIERAVECGWGAGSPEGEEVGQRPRCVLRGGVTGLVQFAEAVAGGTDAHFARLEGEPVALTDNGGSLRVEQLPGEGAAGRYEGGDRAIRGNGDAARRAGEYRICGQCSPVVQDTR